MKAVKGIGKWGVKMAACTTTIEPHKQRVIENEVQQRVLLENEPMTQKASMLAYLAIHIGYKPIEAIPIVSTRPCVTVKVVREVED